MLVKFEYKDRSTRFLKPTELFFQRDLKGKIDIDMLSKKLKALADSTGRCHTLQCFYGDKLLYEIENEKNAPAPLIKKSEKKKNHDKKHHRAEIALAKKELGSKEFTIISIRGKVFSISDLKQMRKEKRKIA